MIRKQIYLTEKMNEELQLLVRRGQAESQADFIRDAVEEKVEKVTPKKMPLGEALAQASKLCHFSRKKGPKYLSRDIDKILYG